MQAILSGIHGNLEALEAVLARIAELGLDEIVCLGDVVGYGPDPIKCLHAAGKFTVVVTGDWDRVLVEYDPNEWSPFLNRQIERLRSVVADATDGDSLLAQVAAFRPLHRQHGFTYCHATPFGLRDFVFPEEIYCPQKLDRIATTFENVLFNSHTHIPGLFVRAEGVGEAEGGDERWRYLEADPGKRYEVSDAEKLICNVGSVGQPRDGDCRASFVQFDGRSIVFHRVEYDVAKTVAKVESDPTIDPIHGQRLPEGR